MNVLVMFGHVMLGPMVGIVEFAWAPLDAEFFLALSVA